ncbi:L-alanine-DL-glutamate epimerase-like enolase superfamily enzyme [Rhizobium sp. BK313]|uniref:mandelate racemase/muconate lactonizing enzyme family protein n=1 Tax=Rhizobium sp. BK313 TaxID=2587081 RepID=UPI001061C1CC|nr:mandelate racemase/muconate lactonizing enzyme family protein [Rhizobium sp. BK313]MBB3457968.1 L-alanine-DL-glutamate epimerase-like enolase superfamily enzyme [Rhizobium sp. BK313]
MKINDLKCAMIGRNLIVRVVSDEGLSGYGAVESFKASLKPQVMALRDVLIGMDPSTVERCVRKIRARGSFKPNGAAVSAVEVALWDLAGRAAGLPVHKLLGGKVRDTVRVYNGAMRAPMTGFGVEDFRAAALYMRDQPEGFTIVKQGIAFHGSMKNRTGLHYGAAQPGRSFPGTIVSGMLTEKGLDHLVACVAATKEVLGKDIGLALDCGPGFTPVDALKFARALEPYNILWLEDLIAGDYTPYVQADIYRDISTRSLVPIHTGEQIYLRQNFKELIDRRAVHVIGPDPFDVGGLAELKWIAEYADLYGIQVAPHGIGNGLIGLAALTQLCATLPDNFIAFEYPAGEPSWWYEILEGLPDPIVTDGFVSVSDRPGLGIDFNVERTLPHLGEEDRDFFQ